jgi:hypothetical protein
LLLFLYDYFFFLWVVVPPIRGCPGDFYSIKLLTSYDVLTCQSILPIISSLSCICHWISHQWSQGWIEEESRWLLELHSLAYSVSHSG